MNCQILRKKLVTLHKLHLYMGTMTDNIRTEWRTETCDTPIFGQHGRKVCDSCLSGWTHEHNFMLDLPENMHLLDEERSRK